MDEYAYLGWDLEEWLRRLEDKAWARNVVSLMPRMPKSDPNDTSHHWKCCPDRKCYSFPLPYRLIRAWRGGD